VLCERAKGAVVIEVATRRISAESLRRRFGQDALMLDVTSRGDEPWVRFSPFFPHGDIPVPFSPGVCAASVEGIWQGLKVFERADVDVSKFAVTTMRGIKRSSRQYGAVLGHRAGVAGDRLLPYVEARRSIYLPSYRWVLDHYLRDLVAQLRRLAQDRVVVLLDYTTNCDVDDLSQPLSHACLIKRYIDRTWPTENRIPAASTSLDDPSVPPTMRDRTPSPPDPVDGDGLIHAAQEGVRALRADRKHGASWLSREAARLLARLTSDVPEAETARRLALVRDTARDLAEARPSMAALMNTAARIWQAGVQGPLEAAQQVARMHAEAERLIGAWESAAEEIAINARPLLAGSIFTLSRSGTVEAVLGRLARDDGEGERGVSRVIVAESRPGGEGIVLARALAAPGLDVALVPDAAMGAYIGEASAVVLGADSIRADGGVVNKVGSYPLALVAREAGIPVYALAETLKIAAPDFPLVFEPLEWPELPQSLPSGVTARSVGFELVPAALITAVITEAGVLDRARIAARARGAGEALAAFLAPGNSSSAQENTR
jgi:translation initiation factor 2B subunit (eIF-2B alpha/beta/delta family)